MTNEPTARLGNANKQNRQRGGFTLLELFVVLVGFIILIALLLPATRSSREPARRSHCKNNFKQLGLALHNYADTYGGFPPAYTVDADGNRLHSWRTLILPFMDAKSLYEQIDLSKPWDDPVNAEAARNIPGFYLCPSAYPRDAKTTYLAVVTQNSCIQPTTPRPISEITDGTTNTIVLIEVDAKQAVHWMSPTDADESLVCSASPNSPLPHQDGMHALFADGHVQFLSAKMPVADRKALITIDGNEPVER